MPGTCSNSAAAIATTAIVSADPDLPHTEPRPTFRNASTGAHTTPLALAAPMGGDAPMGDDAQPMLQFTAACNGLASERQPAQPNDLPRPPSRLLTTTNAAAVPLGGDLLLPMAGAARTDGEVPPAPHSTAAHDDLTTGHQPNQPGDPPRPPPQPFTLTIAGAPLGGDSDAPMGGDERPDGNSPSALPFTTLRARTATAPQPTLPTDRPRPPSQSSTTTLVTAPLGGDLAAKTTLVIRLGDDERPVGDAPMGRQMPPPTSAGDAPALVHHPAHPTASPRPPPQPSTTTT